MWDPWIFLNPPGELKDIIFVVSHKKLSLIHVHFLMNLFSVSRDIFGFPMRWVTKTLHLSAAAPAPQSHSRAPCGPPVMELGYNPSLVVDGGILLPACSYILEKLKCSQWTGSALRGSSQSEAFVKHFGGP